MFNDQERRDATEHALDTLLWTGVHYDETGDGTPLDDLVGTGDVVESDRVKLHAMISAAIDSVQELCEAHGWEYPGNAEQFGHDFILTANGHGAGFWDRGYGDMGQAISDLVRPYGDIDAYIGDDGRVHIEGI